MKESARAAICAVPAPRLLTSFCLLIALALLLSAGCGQGKHTSDPRLRQIDEMLDAQLHPGTPRSRVSFYLSSQGFSEEISTDPHAIVAIARHVDPGTLQPEIARVTFHFDANDKLLSYELVRASGATQQP
jgi:hypothetical protein